MFSGDELSLSSAVECVQSKEENAESKEMYGLH